MWGRMKVGKGGIAGVVAAFEWSSKRDYKADCKVWEARLRHISDEAATIPGVRAEIYYRTLGNEVPYVAISWDETRSGISRQQCVDALRSGDPQIEVIGGVYREVVQKSAEPQFKETPHTGEPERLLAIASNTLKPGEEKTIARRLKEMLGPPAQRASLALISAPVTFA